MEVMLAEEGARVSPGLQLKQLAKMCTVYSESWKDYKMSRPGEENHVLRVAHSISVPA